MQSNFLVTPDIALAAPLLGMLACATFIDFQQQRIPNGLSLGAVLVGLGMQGALFGVSGIAFGLLGWAVGLACFLPFYIGGGMAAGDVKLMAAVGVFLGPVEAFAAALATMIAGALVAAVWLAWRRLERSFGAVVDSGGSAYGAHDLDAPDCERQARIPYAIAIAIGATLVVLEPPLITSILNGGWS